ncbi:hypothetical protein [Streptomyces rubellomurinus]|uniref:Uncharacterized protein n=2 Tax=Streptomyces TaxID=1883 RepID=A0A0F2TK49_STRR3|nr:hypothetical protein [Streptomyces rubellomurinus]KJS57007.1 hypothetical protein VM98_03665 [Streptomyces rubellomurinus subsp. indigoferus]KJS62655.1 hypothetical protein VM95_07645 [Streptomyces rubellomurinus]
MSLRGKIRKLAVITVVTGAAALAAPAPAMAAWHVSDAQSAMSMSTGSAGVGLFGPHANWLNADSYTDDFCAGDC